jgi:hypothetical protein
MSKVSISDEERARRSELARRLHAEGKFGGPQPGSGRPRKRRAAEIVAEEAAAEAQAIVKVFKDAIDPGAPLHLRLQGARDWLTLEQREAALQMAEEKALEGMHRDQLVAELASRLGRLIDAEAIVLPEVTARVEELTSGE